MKILTAPIVKEIVYNSLKANNVGWKYTKFKRTYNEIADIILQTKQFNVYIKFKVTNKDELRYSALKNNTLNFLSKLHAKRRNNLCYIFIYFTKHKMLVAVDIESMLKMKTGRITLEDALKYGHSITGWKNINNYFKSIHKAKIYIPRRTKRCGHMWHLENTEESFKRSKSRRHSMGVCAKCGAVRFNFENFVRDIELKSGEETLIERE